ncbi:MAG TPA: pectin acetylesterase-family hydrolase [Enhygromyxa sp.]|nr:pectin acetylesterase-family hydrolase [Enhygromyxa sp.]
MRAIPAVLLSSSLLLACANEEPGSDTDTSDSGDGETGDEAAEQGDGDGDGDGEDPFAEVYEQGLTEHLGTVDPASTIEDGDSTHYLFDAADGPMCLRGGDYWMSVRRGSHDGGDLVIFQQGGGACWSDLCSAFESLGAPAVPSTGMLNPNLSNNAFADWNVVYLPYCDGSLFVGDVEIDDDQDGAIDRFHHGLINLSAGLDVAKQQFPDATRIVLAGASAGSYGVHVSNMLVRALWPEAELIIVADSGVGIGRPDNFEFIPDLLDEWNALRLVPESCSTCVTDHITGLPDWQLARDPNMRFAAISSYHDAVIGGVFLQLASGEYQAALTSELAELAANHPGRYHRFLFSSTLHTTIGADTQSGGGFEGLTATYDGTVVNGTSVADWLGMLVEGDSAFGDRIE